MLCMWIVNAYVKNYEKYAFLHVMRVILLIFTMGAHRLHDACRRSLPCEVGTWLRALTWHEVLGKCLQWTCDESAWPRMSFVWTSMYRLGWLMARFLLMWWCFWNNCTILKSCFVTCLDCYTFLMAMHLWAMIYFVLLLLTCSLW